MSIRSTTTSVLTAQPPGLPENFPPLELPDGSTVLQSRTQEVGDGRVLSETFFDARVNAARQYEHFLRALERAGYEILDEHLTEGERLSAYTINAVRRYLAVTITGGAGAVGEESERLAAAENPFVVTVAPGGG